MELTKTQELDLLYYMVLTRTLEERFEILLKQGKVIGGLFRSLGQEATAVGSAYALDDKYGDILSPLTRDLGALLVRGCTTRQVLSQYLARAKAPSRGRDLNIHFSDLARGVLGPVSPLGRLVAVMNGVVLACRMQGKKSIGMVYIGDGTTSTGVFHEAANFASVQNLPLIIIGENNAYAYSTPISKQMKILNLADRVKAYGMPSEIVDGNDVIAMYNASRRAVDRARNGGGPTFIEAKTFRMKGHSSHDNQAYIPQGLFEYWRKRDPIDMYKRSLLERGVASKEEIEGVGYKAQSLVEADLAWAEKQEEPSPEEVYGGVYAGDDIKETVNVSGGKKT